MRIRPLTAGDMDFVGDIDGTIESLEYLHVERGGEGLNAAWSLQKRPLRQKLIVSNPLTDEQLFAARSLVGGMEEGLALAAEHEGEMAALLLAQVRPERGALEVLDLRVNYEHRRQGLATVLLYEAINESRRRNLRAVLAHTRTDNHPANALMLHCGFEMTGIDTRHRSNHDLVKEAVTLFWYVPLD